MKKRVYGVVGISSIMANFNADFDGYPKTNSDDRVFGSDKALKYPIKKMWEQAGEKVLYIKSMKLEKDKIAPRSLAERYEFVFKKEEGALKKEKGEEVLKNLFLTIDVKNFGATFLKKGSKKGSEEESEKGNNFAIVGAVQIGQGFNFYEGHEAFEQEILSPFRVDPKDSPDKEKENSSIGRKIQSNEAHYFFPFTINPKAYEEYIKMGVTEGYSEEDYKKLKEALLSASTAFDTNSKKGCDNEFALFVETEEDYYLPNLDRYISFEKGEEKNIITLTCDDLLNNMGDKIKSIELYFNPNLTEVNHNIQNVKSYHIVTRKEL